MSAFCGERTDSGIRELLPPLPLVTSRLRRAYGKCRVQEEYSLFCPMKQVRIGVRRPAQIARDFFKDILERRRCCNAFIYRETQAIRLTRSVIRILSENDRLHTIELTHIECSKDPLRMRKYRTLPIFSFYE